MSVRRYSGVECDDMMCEAVLVIHVTYGCIWIWCDTLKHDTMWYSVNLLFVVYINRV